MCGFAGVMAWKDRYRADTDLLNRMAARIGHRGPDGRDLWINKQHDISPSQPQIAMAFCRLSIIDLDPRAMQPMTDGRHHLVFNGEIYNFLELRNQLDQISPHPWQTTGDTEVLLRACAQWPDDCLTRLEGMFAFALWNSADQSLTLARDRMGQKPLYYAWASDRQALAFASEMTALREVPWIDWSTRPTGVESYLRYGYIPRGGSGTIYRHICQLPPATRMIVRDRCATHHRYFDANAVSDTNIATIEDAVKTTRRLVLGAVRRQLIADVPLGCFLSGGIDSSIIAAAMKHAINQQTGAGNAAGQRVLTFSIGFDDPRYDETQYAAEVAAHLGTEHRAFIVKPDAANDLPKLAALFGEPFADSSALPMHYLSRETRAHVKVALSGDGGDELFGGYDRYRAMQLARTARWMPRFLRLPLMHLPGSHPKSTGARLRRFLSSVQEPPDARYADYLRLFSDEQLSDLGAFRDGFAIDRFLYRCMNLRRDDVRAALALDRLMYLPGDLLTKVDRCSMLHGLETRSPFMDHALVQFAAGLPADQLLRGGGKRLLRLAFARDLPARVFKRRKMGFALPIGQWLRTSLRPMLHDLIFAQDSFAAAHFQREPIERLIRQHQDQSADHSQRLYALLMLELWWSAQGG